MPSGFAADLPRRSVRFRRAITALDDATALVGYLCVKYYLFGIGVRWRAALTRYDFCHAMDAMSLFAARGFAAGGVPVVLDVNEIVALLTLRSAFSNRRFGRIAAALQAAGASVAGFDTDIGRAAPAAAQPSWLTTIAIR